MNSQVSKGNMIVGMRQSLKALKHGRVNIIYIAKDADQKVVTPVEQRCNSLNIPISYINTMRELGKLCGIDIGAAVACKIKNENMKGGARIANV